MKFRSSIAIVVVLSCLAAAAARGEGRGTEPVRPSARYVPAEIRLDGEVILRGSASDDGRPDVDAVWDYQLGTLAYAPTEAFAALGVPKDAKEWTLELPQKGEDAGEPQAAAPGTGAADATKPRRRRPAAWTIEVVVSYGGEARARSLRLVRGKVQPSSGGDWYLHPEEVARLFGSRLVHRDDVVRIEDPARKK